MTAVPVVVPFRSETRPISGFPAELEWRVAEPGDGAKVLAAIAEGDVAPSAFAAWDLQVQLADLPWYRQFRLAYVQGRLPHRGAPLEPCYVLWDGDARGAWLTGESTPVHAVNDAERLQLDEAQVPGYVRFFCFAIRGGDGPFVIVEEALPGARPLTVRFEDDDGRYRLTTRVAHGDQLWEAELSVSASGEVTMVESDPVGPLGDGAAALDLPPSLGQLSRLRAQLAGAAVGASAAAPTRRTAAPPAELVLTELRLARALHATSRHRLLEHFNDAQSGFTGLDGFARLMCSGSPIVAIEEAPPFVEETIARIITARAPDGDAPRVVAGEVADDLLSYRLTPELGGLVLVPLQTYRGVADVSRLAHRVAVDECAAVITCDRLAQVPEPLRRVVDLVLRLPPIDPDIFAQTFATVLDAPPPIGWDADGADWVRQVLANDFDHPRRLQLEAAPALAYIRAQVLERLRAVDAAGSIGLESLHGLGEARAFALDLIADLRAAMAGTLPWTQVDRGALLAGPPGTGKTTLARAIARDCGVRFIAASASGWMASSEHLGEHIRQIRGSFAEARRYAPSILFIDEIDSLGNRENFSGSNASYMTGVVNAVLEQMQELDPTAPVVVLAATNHEGNVDPALRRAGRLDRVIRIPLPNGAALSQIYTHYLSVAGLPSAAPAVQADLLGALSLGCTGADVQRIVRGAARRARREGRTVAQADLVAELTNKPRHDEESLRRLTPAELERTAVHEAGHALAMFLGGAGGADIGFVSVVPRSDGSLGFVAPLPDERVSYTRDDYLERIGVCLAGRAAEELRYGERGVSGGAASDLHSATAYALQMVLRLGLGDARRLAVAGEPSERDRREVEDLLRTRYDLVRDQLADHRTRLMSLADALIARQELAGDEVRTILAAG
jgi:hypothetical protein